MFVIGEKESEVNLHIQDRQMTGSVRTQSETFYFEVDILSIVSGKN